MRRSHSPGQDRPVSPSNSSLAGLVRRRGFQSRLRLWAFLLTAVLFLLAGRLIHLQVFRHSHYLRRARASHLRKWLLPAPRGAILDRNGTSLAVSIIHKSVFADPSLFPGNFPAAVSEGSFMQTRTGAAMVHRNQENAEGEEHLLEVASLLGMDPAYLQQQLKVPGQFLRLKRFVPESLAKRVAGLKLRWLGLVEEEKRVYPYGAMAAQTLGFVGSDGQGLAGIEAGQNSLLAGRPGKVCLEVDARGRPIPGLRAVKVSPRPGRDLTLTIDAPLQQIAEMELARGVKAASASGGMVLMMDPDNGEILALASQPAFDPNSFQQTPPHRWVNPAVVGAYEPGSTFKLVVACAVLEEGILLPSTRVFCSGEKAIGRHIIHCSVHGGTRAHGEVDLEKIIEKSCNIGAATLALRLGAERFAHYVKALGFGEKTGIELAAESPGLLSPSSTWSDIRLANLGFGQGISVTPLQLLRAYCVVANGGRLVRPHLVQKPPWENDRGVRVLSEETARQMRRLLVQVIENGTGKTAAVQGYLVAGKTGTAQKPLPGMGYRSEKYIASFIGFVPAENPRLALLVLLDEPKGSHYGGVVAAPIFREVAKQALLRLAIPSAEMEIASADAASQAHR